MKLVLVTPLSVSASPVRSPWQVVWRVTSVCALVAGLWACSSTSEKPKPKDLTPNVGLIGVKQAWATRIGEVGFPLTVSVARNELTVASSDGSVMALDARTGAEKWRRQFAEPLAAGVGSDGKIAAVVTRGNYLVALDGTRELWRQKLSAQTYTVPLVAGGRVFVVTADRTIAAFDGLTGQRLWQQTKQGEPLILKQAGVLLAVGDTLVVGQSGRLAGLNPSNGTARWEAPVASSRGTNDVERLVDLVGPASRVGDVVCARAFQSNVGCVNATRGAQIWTQTANGFEGLHGDATRVVGSEADGKLVAWRRTDGQRLWSSDRLQYRNLTAPLVLGRSTVVGDGTGLLHFVSSEDGTPLSRVSTDGSAIVGGPIVVDGTLVVVTKNGGVFGFVPE